MTHGLNTDVGEQYQLGQRIWRTSLTKMTDDLETKLGLDTAACDDEVFSVSREQIVESCVFATEGEASVNAKHVLAKVRPNLFIYCSNCAFTVHIHLKTFNTYYQHKVPL